MFCSTKKKILPWPILLRKRGDEERPNAQGRAKRGFGRTERKGWSASVIFLREPEIRLGEEKRKKKCMLQLNPGMGRAWMVGAHPPQNTVLVLEKGVILSVQAGGGEGQRMRQKWRSGSITHFDWKKRGFSVEYHREEKLFLCRIMGEGERDTRWQRRSRWIPKGLLIVQWWEKKLKEEASTLVCSKKKKKKAQTADPKKKKGEHSHTAVQKRRKTWSYSKKKKKGKASPTELSQKTFAQVRILRRWMKEFRIWACL